MDSWEVQVCEVIKGLELHLQEYRNWVLTMDVVFVDFPSKWGMLLSQEWGTDTGGSIQMDCSYVNIPIAPRYKLRLYREKKMLHNIEDPHPLDNESLYLDLSKLELIT